MENLSDGAGSKRGNMDPAWVLKLVKLQFDIVHSFAGVFALSVILARGAGVQIIVHRAFIQSLCC